MSRTGIFIGAAALAVAGFAGGIGYMRWQQPGRETAPHAKQQRRILYYVDPMHPAYRSDKPGTAPDCGMELEPVYADDPLRSSSALRATDMPPGTIHIPLEKQQLIGVRYGQAEYTNTGDTLRAVGSVATDETRVSHVHTKVEGWIENVHADFSGAYVHKGDPLLTIYSPDMLASEKEFLLALRAREVMKSGAIASAVESSESLVEASRRRLELWDLSQSQIDQVIETKTPIRSVTIYSPAQGFVTNRNSFPNQRVTPETELYTLADLSRVWIMADVFEADLSKVRLGQSAVVKAPYASTTFSARVSFIQPQVDPQTRTVKLRLEASNPGMRLKPGMFVDVDLRVPGEHLLSVPADAVLDSGEKQVVFIDRGNGFIEPREVHAGDRVGDRIVIMNGLAPGERIVTSANFLVDSESELKAALSGMKSGNREAHP